MDGLHNRSDSCEFRLNRGIEIPLISEEPNNVGFVRSVPEGDNEGHFDEGSNMPQPSEGADDGREKKNVDGDRHAFGSGLRDENERFMKQNDASEGRVFRLVAHVHIVAGVEDVRSVESSGERVEKALFLDKQARGRGMGG